MIGTKLAHYEITAKIGEGGMGEVYRAQDLKLGREVAIKVLPEAFAQVPDRLARFAREAQVLASLNHSNIASIYGFEEDGDRHALVMELVEGETLEERIRRGPVSLEETARIGLEMARALEAAHEKGIVHRDLKPANVKITPQGQVKVLDFGLAKALEGETPAADLANSPTLTAAATQAGIILGTAAYMSPEQAAGTAADRRADVWSFGVVLSEMLSGRQQFGGQTVSHTLASVLKDEPSWESLPADLPPRLLELLQRCLRKDPNLRLQAIGDARVILEEYLADPAAFAPATTSGGIPAPARPLWRRILPWAVTAALAVALGLTALRLAEVTDRHDPVLRASILPPERHDWSLGSTNPGRVALSPDGLQLAYAAVAEGGGDPLLWVHPLDSPIGRPLPNTEGAGYPFWSPDGRYVAFFAKGKLKKIAVGGGPPVSLCDASYGKSGSWSRQGNIVFASSSNGGLSRVPAAGGDCVPITELNEDAGENSHRHPMFLPDGQHFLYLVRRSGTKITNQLRVGSLDGQTDLDLIETPSNAAYASGRLLFIREGTLMAQSFDPEALELHGEAVPLVERVLEIGGAALHVFSVSETGRLIYQSGEATQESQLVWLDREGSEIGPLGDAVDQNGIAVSADGRSVAASSAGEEGAVDLWIYDATRQLRSRFTFAAARDVAPAWSPDGTRVAFASDREGGSFDVYLKEVGGTGDSQLLLSRETPLFPYSWTPDGRALLVEENGTGSKEALLLLPLEGGSEPVELVQEEFGLNDPTVSPDGRWLAYTANESERREVYVTTFPKAERRWQVSIEGGRQPRWTRDGSEIVFLSGTFDAIYAAEVDSHGETFEVGQLRKLFDVGLRQDIGRDWDVTADGERFLINAAPERGRVSALNLVDHWPELLEER